MALDQLHYRFRGDTQDETSDGTDWLAAEDTPITRWSNINTRLRTLVDVTSGDPDASQYRLEYRLQGTAQWYVVGTGETANISSPSASVSPSGSPSISPSISPSASMSPSSSPSASPSPGIDYYVRPSGGSYGSENGTSYDNAWDGFADITWGAGGVVAGDTLYVCGTHREQMTVGASGSAGSVITIRGDYVGDPGVILASDAITTWTYEATNLWYATLATDPATVWFINVSDGKTKWGTEEALKASLSAEYEWWWDDPNNRLYVYVAGGDVPASDPDNRYTSVEAALRSACILHNSNSYITISNLELAFGGTYGINCCHITPTNWTITENVIHHFGTWPLGGSGNTGIGINFGKSAIISYNTVYESGGGGIQNYAYNASYDFGDFIVEHNEVYNVYYCHINFPISSGTINNGIIRYNKVYNTDDYADTSIRTTGIYFQGSSAHPMDNWNVYYNLVYSIMGTAFKLGNYVTNCNIFNNVFYKSHESIDELESEGLYISTTGVSGIVINNNIGVDWTSGCFLILDATKISACNNNLWYQSSGGTSKYVETVTPVNSYHFDDQATYITDTEFDNDGKWEDPLFVNAAGSDFRLQSGSPCRNAGVDVGLTVDRLGNAIIGSPDIGAYESGYESPSVSPSISPSRSPSRSPSVSPSLSPSASVSPSRSPSVSPSVSPSGSPSVSPSVSPSESPSAVGPAYEDYTTFTETDTGGYLTVDSATKVTFTGLLRSVDSYLYLDKTANYYSGDFSFTLDVVKTAHSDNALIVLVGVSNSVDDLWNATGRQSVQFYGSGANNTYTIRVGDAGGNTASATAFTEGTKYYIRFRRVDGTGTYGTLYADVYPTAADRTASTNVIETVSRALGSKIDLRYLFSPASMNAGSDYWVSGTVENLFQESP